MRNETKVGRHAAPETGDAKRSGSFTETLIDILTERFIDNESATEREAKETVKTAVRVGEKINYKASFWLRAFALTVFAYVVVLIIGAAWPNEILQQANIVLPLASLGAVFMWQAGIITGSYLWKQTQPIMKRLLGMVAWMEVWALVALFLPLHTKRSLILPFIAILLTIWLFKRSEQEGKKKSAMPILLWVVIAIMTLVFLFSGINFSSVEVENSGQIMGYTSGTPTSPAPSPATPQATASPSTDKPDPAVNPVSEPEAILGPRSSVSPEYAEPGSLVHSTIIVDNVSSVEAKSVHVTIELAEGLIFADTGLRVREVDLGNIPGHGEIPINSTLQVAENAPAGGYDNWVHVRADNYPGISVPHALTVVQN